MKEIYYHGSHIKFDRFDLVHALEGSGKVKFGYGVYVTSSFNSAAHYSGAKADAEANYVYTVEVPEKHEDNYIAFKKEVHPAIIQRAILKLGEKIPEKIKADGKEFRKYLAKKLTDKVDLEGEKAASDFLLGIGVKFIEWPYNWKNPNAGTNRAILDEHSIKITKIEQVELDEKKRFIVGSNKLINKIGV